VRHAFGFAHQAGYFGRVLALPKQRQAPGTSLPEFKAAGFIRDAPLFLAQHGGGRLALVVGGVAARSRTKRASVIPRVLKLDPAPLAPRGNAFGCNFLAPP
jgi:hypothetical protein